MLDFWLLNSNYFFIFINLELEFRIMFKSIEDLLDKDEKSIVCIEKLVKWKKAEKHYNFGKLPKTAIMTIFP